jgi:hypothetical protein
MDSPLRQGYHYRVVMQLADFYLRQERIKDAADTLAAFVRQQPLHPQAPLLQARVVDIYANAGFDTWRCRPRRTTCCATAPQRIPPRQPQRLGGAQPLVKAHLAATGTAPPRAGAKTKAQADVQEAVRWYRSCCSPFPMTPRRCKAASCWPNCCLRTGSLAGHHRIRDRGLQRAGGHHTQPAQRAADAGYAALLSIRRAGKGQRRHRDKTALQRQAVAGALRFADRPLWPTRVPVPCSRTRPNSSTRWAKCEPASQVAQALWRCNPRPPPNSAEWPGRWWRTRPSRPAPLPRPKAPTAKCWHSRPQPAAAAPRWWSARPRPSTAGRARTQRRRHTRLPWATLRASASWPRCRPQSALRATAQFDTAAALIALKDWDTAPHRRCRTSGASLPATRCRPRWRPSWRWPTWNWAATCRPRPSSKVVAGQHSDPPWPRARCGRRLNCTSRRPPEGRAQVAPAGHSHQCLAALSAGPPAAAWKRPCWRAGNWPR